MADQKDMARVEPRPFRGAIKWSFLMSWGVAAGNAATMMVLAAILGPHAYGLVSLASIVIILFQLMVELGMSQALIQYRKIEPSHFDSAFCLISSTAWLIFFTLLFLRFVVYGEPFNELFEVVFWLSVRVPIYASTIVHIAVLRREMNIKPIAIQSNVGVIAGAATGITMALNDFGYWSLVAQQIVEASVGLLVIWYLSSWRPRLKITLQSLKDIFRFSSATFLTNVGVFTFMRGDAAVMGYFFGPTAVGIYRLALRLVNLCSDISTQAVNFAALPEMARNQNDAVNLRASLIKCLHIAAVVSIGLLGILAATFDELLALLGPKWQDARTPLLLLCIVGAIQVVSIISTSMLQAIGRPELNAKLTWLWGVLVIAATATIGTYFADAQPYEQIIAVCLAHISLSAILHLPTYAFILKRMSSVTVLDIVKVFYPPILAAITVFVVVSVLRPQILAYIDFSLLQLATTGFLAVTVFAVTLFLVDVRMRKYTISIVSDVGNRQSHKLSKDG